MAVGNGYTTSIRQALNDKGVSNDRITYNNSSGVMVDGNSFYKPEKMYDGSGFTSPTNFANAWNNYSKTQNKTNNATTSYQPSNTSAYNTANTAANVASQAMGNYNAQNSQANTSGQYNYNPYANNSMINNNPYTSQADQLIQQLLNYNNNQQAFDPYSTSSYQAAQAQANRAAQQNTRAAQEAYGSSGFGRSTALGERVAGINNDATEYLMTQVLPQIEAQEQARRQQEFNNLLSTLNPIFDQQGRADNLVQQDFNNRVTEGQLTGNYMNPEASALINQLLNLKTDTETNWQTLTPEQRTAARQQGDAYRNQIAALGYSPDLFSADTTANAASQNRGVATRTLEGQQLDYNKELNDRNFAYQQERDAIADQQWQQQFGVTLAQITGFLPDGTKTSDQQQREIANLWTIADQTGAIPNALADMYGIPHGTQTRAAKEFAAQLAIQQQNANSSSTSAAASMMNAQTNRQQENRIAAGGGSSGGSSSSGSSSTGKVSAKDSANSFLDLQSQVIDGVRQGLTQSQAISFIQQNSNEFTDSDYNKAIKWVQDYFKPE